MLDKKWPVLLIFCLFARSLLPKVIHQQVVATTKELIQGRQFVHTYQMRDGITKQEWAIDGSLVDKATYEDTLLVAEMDERRLEREKGYAAQAEELAAQQRMQQDVLKKLVRKATKTIREQLAKIDGYQLLPYLAYDQQSLTQEQFEGTLELLSQADALGGTSEAAISELQTVVKRLERVERGMKKLVRDSMEQAIAQCDDTEMLKKLLA